MNDKDKIILEDTGIAVADAIVSIIPGLNLAWDLSKALYGAGLKLRQQRALEWVEMIRDNPSIFSEDILKDEKFQDGFAVSLEKYIVERNEDKRRVFKNIFLGFSVAEDKEKFPLEKLLHTLSQLAELDIQVLADVRIEEDGRNYQIYGKSSERIENIYSLISAGLLEDTTGNRAGHSVQISPFVKPTYFAIEFVKYITKNDELGN